MKYFAFLLIIFLSLNCDQQSSSQKQDTKLKAKLDQKSGFREFVLGAHKDSLDLSNLSCTEGWDVKYNRCKVIQYEKYLGVVPIFNLELNIEENILKSISFMFPMAEDNILKVIELLKKEYGKYEIVSNEFTNYENQYMWRAKNTSISILSDLSNETFFVLYQSNIANEKIRKIKYDKYSSENQKKGNEVKL